MRLRVTKNKLQGHKRVPEGEHQQLSSWIPSNDSLLITTFYIHAGFEHGALTLEKRVLRQWTFCLSVTYA